MNCPRMCDACCGGGWIDWGDPENGVIVDCPKCDGEGEIDDEE